MKNNLIGKNVNMKLSNQRLRSTVNTVTHDSTNAYADDIHTQVKSNNFLSRNASTTENNDFRGLKGRNNCDTNISFEKQYVSSKNLKTNDGTRNDDTVA